jgi:hypothetical protein
MPCTVAMWTGVAVRLMSSSSLMPNDVGEGLEVLHACVLEGVGGLLAEGGAVHQEEDAAEALRLQQPVDQRDAGLGLAGAGGHGQQQFALARRWPLRRPGWQPAGSAAAGSRS